MSSYDFCGGCGNSDPDKRCIGCLHPFSKTPTPPDRFQGWKLEIRKRNELWAVSGDKMISMYITELK